MSEGEFKIRIRQNVDVIPKPVIVALEQWIEDAKKEFPTSAFFAGMDPELYFVRTQEWFEKWFGKK